MTAPAPSGPPEISPADLPALGKGRQIPAWLMSFVLHFTVLTSAALVFQVTPRGIAGIEPSKEGGIVLVSTSQGKPAYFSEQGASSGPLESNPSESASSSVSASGAPFPSEIELPKGPGPQLPTQRGIAGAIGIPGGEIAPGATGFATPGGGGGTLGAKGKGKTTRAKVFGVQGDGSSFVYVFDRSGSMEGAPLAAAKRELIDSLKSLDSVHQFQIVFYNQEPRIMQLAPNRVSGMEFGTEQGKKLAETFVGSILADGGTRHMDALELALRMKPDVIFFLTDANDPQLSADELRRIRRLNGGTSINTIEFGSGPASGEYNFLKRLAKENGGNYGYVDTSGL